MLPFSVRRLKATAVPRSHRPSQATTVENASGVRCNGCVGRPVLVCCNCTTSGTPLFRGQGRPGPRRWQAIDGFRSVQRSCPSKPSNEATEASGQRSGERPLRAASRPRAAVRPTDAKPVPLGNLLKKDRWKGEESPRVGPYFRTRETTPWRTNARPPQRSSKRRSQATIDSRRDSPNGEAQTFQGPQTLISGWSRHYLPVEESAKEIQAGQPERVYLKSSRTRSIRSPRSYPGGFQIDPG